MIEKKVATVLAHDIAKSTIIEHILCPYRRSNAVIRDGFHNFFFATDSRNEKNAVNLVRLNCVCVCT